MPSSNASRMVSISRITRLSLEQLFYWKINSGWRHSIPWQFKWVAQWFHSQLNMFSQREISSNLMWVKFSTQRTKPSRGCQFHWQPTSRQDLASIITILYTCSRLSTMLHWINPWPMLKVTTMSKMESQMMTTMKPEKWMTCETDTTGRHTVEYCNIY